MTKLPYKSTAVALLFTVVLGPVGLLYASFWGGILLLPFTIFVVINQYYFVAFLVWLVACFWGVRATEKYNRKLLLLVKPS